MAAAALMALAACSAARTEAADGSAPWPASSVPCAAEWPTSSVPYEAKGAGLASGRFRAAAALAVDPETGEVLVRLALDVGRRLWGRSSIAPDWALATLETAEGTEAPLASLEPAEGAVAPGEERSVTLRFLPVTDPALYARYALAGAPSSAYRLDAGFLRDAAGRRLFAGGFEFEPDERARAVIREASKRLSSLAPYTFSGGPEDFAATQLAYMERAGLLPEAHGHGENAPEGAAAPAAERFVLVSGDEFWLDRWLVKVSPYRLGEDLCARIRLVSKTPERLSIDWSRVFAVAGGATAAPAGAFRETAGRVGSALSPVPAPLELAQNGRAELTLVWPGLGAATSEGFQLRLDGFATAGGARLFAGPIGYAPERR